MPQILAPHQSLLGSFSDASAAEAGVNALKQAGFTPEKLSVMPQSLDPELKQFEGQGVEHWLELLLVA
jgi:hypothetical protein